MARGKQRSCRHRRRPLDIVVEGAEAIAIALEQPRRVVLGEVLPLQQNVGPSLDDRVDEGLDEIIVFLARHPLVAPADIERIVEALRLSVPTSSTIGSVVAGWSPPHPV